nr:MAG TPA: Protein of unknown function (DUF739) [Caudoviricetes sp.]
MQIGLYDYSKLRGLIRAKNCTQEDVAKAAGINPATFSQKLCGKGLFKQDQIAAICNLLNIEPTEIGSYFFSH